MTQRTWAALVALPLFLVLGVFTAVSPLPFVTFAPGATVNVLGDNGHRPIIRVQGHPTYRDDGELRMTTVSVTQRDAKLDLFTLMRTWFSPHDAIYPYAIEYGNSGSQQQDQQEGQAEMIDSQDSAIAAALRRLGYDVHPTLQILTVDPSMPAAGKLRPRDVLRRFDGHPVTATTDLGKLVQAVPDGRSVPITVLRGDRTVTVHVAPKTTDGTRLIGVKLGIGYDFPFKVSVDIDKNIGGPSAGLMFALSIYDTLTPGSLTEGSVVAGTGTIDGLGHVGEIGGIQQKIAGARDDGAQLFLVPPANCPDAITSDHGSMRLARAATLKQAISEVTAWSKDHNAPLPQCTAADRRAS
ncbi:MAG TPA: PDZ domain-containing protein [Nocardioides sp.]|jgi:PDZ domain-containing protein|nr:PDZ domain-containing protein [Nocardioides sp.]